jgi:hypothetical protein
MQNTDLEAKSSEFSDSQKISTHQKEMNSETYDVDKQTSQFEN